MTTNITSFKGLDLFNNPLNLSDGSLIKSVNVDSFPLGAKTKRMGYQPFLNNPGSARVTTLFDFEKNDGTTSFHYNYMMAGSILYFNDINGTSSTWTPCENGTLSNNATVGYAVLNNVMMIGDGVTATKHTTNGTTFVDTSGAPVSRSFAEFGGRMFAAGTSNYLTASSPTDATNWSSTGTSTSFDLFIPGAGKNNLIFNTDDRLMIGKTSGQLFRWNGDTLVDTGTSLGPQDEVSLSEIEGYHFWLNQLGIYGYGGASPQLHSNAVQRQIYNPDGTGISNFASPGIAHKFDYLLSVGDITDDFTDTQIINAIIKYDYQKNFFDNYSLYDQPTAFNAYTDSNGVLRLIFGTESGQCYTMFSGNSDNGQPIFSEMIGIVTGEAFDLAKEFNWMSVLLNPGNQARIQVAISDTFQKTNLRWMDLGDCSSGVVNFRFPPESRGNILYYKVSEGSTTSQFSLYGITVDYDYVPK